MNYELMWEELKKQIGTHSLANHDLAWQHIYNGFLEWMNKIEENHKDDNQS